MLRNIILGLFFIFIIPQLSVAKNDRGKLYPRVTQVQLIEHNLLGIRLRFEDNFGTSHLVHKKYFHTFQLDNDFTSWWQVKYQKTYKNMHGIYQAKNILAYIQRKPQKIGRVIALLGKSFDLKVIVQQKRRKKETSYPVFSEVKHVYFFNGEVHIKDKTQKMKQFHHQFSKLKFHPSSTSEKVISSRTQSIITKNFFSGLENHSKEILLLLPLKKKEIPKALTIHYKAETTLLKYNKKGISLNFVLTQADQNYLQQEFNLKPHEGFYKKLQLLRKEYQKKNYQKITAQNDQFRLKNIEQFKKTSIPLQAEWSILTAISQLKQKKLKKAETLFKTIIHNYPETSFASDSWKYLSQQRFKTINNNLSK
jgi:hypothetical protein